MEIKNDKTGEAQAQAKKEAQKDIMITILKRINDLEIQVKADLQKARGAK